MNCRTMGKKKEKKKAKPNNKNVYFSLFLLASEAHGFKKKKKSLLFFTSPACHCHVILIYPLLRLEDKKLYQVLISSMF